jgi:hypothetical protein
MQSWRSCWRSADLLKDFSGVEVVGAVWAMTASLAKINIASEIQQQLDKRRIVWPPCVGLSGTEAWRLRAAASHFRKRNLCGLWECWWY